MAKLRVAVTDVDSYLYYCNEDVDMTLDELLARLRRETEPTDELLAGIAWHKALENLDDQSELLLIEQDGYRFTIEADIELPYAEQREIKKEAVFTIGEHEVTLVGKADVVNANSVADYKLTSNPNLEKYFDAFQWRAYLVIFQALFFEYLVFQAYVKGKDVTIKNMHAFKTWTYTDIKNDVIDMLTRYVEFAEQHCPDVIGLAPKWPKAITWDELADIYQRETGVTARIQPMETVADWAASRTDLFGIRDDDCFYLKPQE